MLAGLKGAKFDAIMAVPEWQSKAVAQGFGLKGARVNTPGRFESLFREHQRSGGTTLWDVHVDDLIPSRAYRRVHYGEA